MVTVYVFAEGQTEESFIKNVVAPSLSYLGIYLIPMLMPTSKSGRGGAISYQRLIRNAKNLLAQQNDTYLTTFFDYYQLDNAFPGFDQLETKNGIYNKVVHLETSLHTQLIQEIGCRPERFIPHIQPHEYEALLFSDVEKLVSIEPDWIECLDKLVRVRNEYESPEHINNSFETAPSKRLEKLLNPKYRKTRHGPLIAKAISLEVIEQECSHFKAWMDKLRSLC